MRAARVSGDVKAWCGKGASKRGKSGGRRRRTTRGAHDRLANASHLNARVRVSVCMDVRQHPSPVDAIALARRKGGRRGGASGRIAGWRIGCSATCTCTSSRSMTVPSWPYCSMSSCESAERLLSRRGTKFGSLEAASLKAGSGDSCASGGSLASASCCDAINGRPKKVRPARVSLHRQRRSGAFRLHVGRGETFRSTIFSGETCFDSWVGSFLYRYASNPGDDARPRRRLRHE